VSGVHTRTGRPDRVEIAPPQSRLAPGLLYHKWQAYDTAAAPFSTEKARLPFLEDVAQSVNDLARGRDASIYGDWHRRYLEALHGLDVDAAESVLAGSTVWRLVAGFATNPALESGLHLHPLHGVPYLPGSSVRGLVRHVAEGELLGEEREGWAGLADPPQGSPDFETFLVEAERIAALLGGLSVQPLRPKGAPDPEAPAAETAFSLLQRWSQSQDRGLPPELRTRLAALVDGHTGGLVAFYDAPPEPGQEGLLQVDILNPHYPDYYKSAGTHPPSDDQNPNPVYFLAVRPGAGFTFPFRLYPWPAASGGDTAEKERRSRLHGFSREEARKQIRAWLLKGLEEHGAGGKTAAGYGYFTFGSSAGSATVEASSQAQAVPVPPAGPGVVAKMVPPARVDWEAWVRRIGMGEAEGQVPRMLQELTGEPRRLAARDLLKKLKKNLKDAKKQNKDWVLRLREAADGGDS
jgi:CRISPR type III-B/RAMP module RAMP protein Cmr6